MALLTRDVPDRMEGEQWDWVAEQTYLTPREKEIVTLLGRGLSRWDVCELLEITRETLRKHIQRIKEKTSV